MAARRTEPNRRRAGFCAAVDRLAEVIERVETALHEPDLVGLRVKRPGSAQHDQLHLGGGVPHTLVGAQAIPGLQVGVEAIVLGSLRAGLVGQIALGHANIVRTEDAPAGTRVRLREHRDGRDTTQSSNRAQSQPRHE